MNNVYEPPSYDGAQALADAIEANDPDILAPMIIAAALYEDDFDIVHAACVRLSSHPDEVVRSNAILGFGHLARLFGRLGEEAPAIVKRGLADESACVRGQAYAAAGDLQHFWISSCAMPPQSSLPPRDPLLSSTKALAKLSAALATRSADGAWDSTGTTPTHTGKAS